MHRIQRAFTFKMMYRNLGTSGGATNSLNRALIRSHQTDYKIWSKNLILESIKGRNSVANLQKKKQFTLLTLILSMMMCIQNLVLFCQFVLKILSKNQILTSIKGRNSVANLRKTKIYNTNLDLVTDNVYTNFGLILSIRSQDIDKKTNFDINQGP